MKFLFVGAGGIGGYYGGRLVQGGANVSFLVRASRAAQLKQSGLRIKSPFGDYTTSPKYHLLDDIDPMTDVVVLSCKAYDLARVLTDIGFRIPAKAVILPLLNGVKHYEPLDQLFGRRRVLGGLCHIGVTLTVTGDILHMNDLQFFAFGPRHLDQADMCHEIGTELNRGNFAPKLSEDIMQDAWEKFSMLAAYAGVTCLMQASVSEILGAPGGQQIFLRAFDEASRVASASGYAPRTFFRKATYETFSDRRSRGTSSMLRDMTKGARVEADHIVGDVVDRAKTFGIDTPILSTAFARLKCYEQARLAV